jgi:hypothetical protein
VRQPSSDAINLEAEGVATPDEVWLEVIHELPIMVANN